MLKLRLLTGFVVCSVVFGVLFFLPAWTHMILILLVFLLAQWEFNAMVRDSGHQYELLATTICGAALLLATALESPLVADLRIRFTWVPDIAASAPGDGGFDFSLLPAGKGRMDLTGIILSLTPALLLACGVFRRRTKQAMETFALSFAGFWYVAVLLSFIIRISFEWRVHEDWSTNYTGRLMLLLFIVLVKVGDVGGYTFGRLFGRHKLIPEISPNKTVEGLFGEYVFSLSAGLLMWAVFHHFFQGWFGQTQFKFVHAVVLPPLLTTTGVLGDLAESLIKRSVGVKDSSSRFPGMGGILDILDSLLFSAPFMYAYMLLFEFK